MYLIFVGVAVIVLLVFIRSFYARQIQYRALRKLPGPSSSYLWGNLFQFTRHIEETFEDIVELNKRYDSPLVTLWSHPWKPLVVIAHPKFIEKILSTNSHVEKSSLYKGMHNFLGYSLVTSDVNTWKRQRKLVNPAFQPRIFELFIPSFEYHGRKLIKILEKEMHKTSIDLPEFVDLYVLDVICEIMTNVRTNYQETADDSYLKARSIYLTIFMNRAYSWLKRYDFFFSFTSEHKTLQRCASTLKKFSQGILESRKEARRNRTSADVDNGLNKTVLDICLDVGLPESEIRDHIDTFIVAGHDTPGSTIAFALYEIAHNYKIQAKVVEESIEILGKDPNADITIPEMQNMIYLECVIKETLRHRTTIQAFERLTDDDITIDGITIPKGTEVSIAVYALHHDEKYYPNPNVFDPDRFLPENSHNIQPYTFIPFAKGPRDCIGKTMAMLLMKFAITRIIRNFELEPVNPPHNIKLTSEFVLKSANGLPVKLKKRVL